ncbi:predicted protein [Aspergillus terreus NIH2624]|uniref:Uncharacterized protein n=1 Tax=Aspergillus terreus (strain NIH 2624 / FGSC A1156) TaxID=341663 RepID=Q0D195_ASPTN|nr:uncharacterized protein ATEG_00289 [Aspergillus terreus NIH2624]EAU38935.1 predicted protein [Aspergillus terreus NIH2624]
MRIYSYVTWFKEEDYIGTVVSFPSGSWKLDRKITENESFNSQTEWETYKLCSEARAVFFCSKVSGDGPSDAVIKIHMQIPWIDTINKGPAIRAQQACSGRFSSARGEVQALSIFTKKNCSSTPTLPDSKHIRQAGDQWIPRGFMWYILMERLPGINPELPFEREMDRAERDALRAAFKVAWL